MRCPKCEVEFDSLVDPKKGTHAEHICCGCGQLLQWDQQISAKEGHLYVGPPHECEHPDRKKADALVPLTQKCKRGRN